MMGLMVLGFFAVYLLISIWVTKKAASWAKANNKKPWLWAGLAAFVMYNLVFWDLIPTLVMHKYYCDTQAGFWVYKTPEQWVKENPDFRLQESSAHDYNGTDNNHTSTTALNQRLNYVSKINPANFWLPIHKSEQYVEDFENKYVLIKRKNYLFGYRDPNSIGQLKIWLQLNNCNKNDGNKSFLAFGEMAEKFKNLGKGETE